MELTSTNRSCGLTTYISAPSSREQKASANRTAGSHQQAARVPTLVVVRVAPGVGAGHLQTIANIKTTFVCLLDEEHDWTTDEPARAGVASHLRFFLAAMPKRSHPFPSRTRKLSFSGPMVLQGQPCGRVGRCRGFESLIERSGSLLFSALELVRLGRLWRFRTARWLRRGPRRAPRDDAGTPSSLRQGSRSLGAPAMTASFSSDFVLG